MTVKTRVTQIMPARPGWRQVFASNQGEVYAEPVEAWGVAEVTTENGDVEHVVVPLVAETDVCVLANRAYQKWSLGLLSPEEADVDLACFAAQAKDIAEEHQRKEAERRAHAQAGKERGR